MTRPWTQVASVVLQLVGTALLAVDVWYIWSVPPMGHYGGQAQRKRREYEREKHTRRQKVLAVIGFVLVLLGLGLNLVAVWG